MMTLTTLDHTQTHTRTAAIRPTADGDSLMGFIGTSCETARVGDHFLAVSRDPDLSGAHLVCLMSYDTSGFRIATGTARQPVGHLSHWLDTSLIHDSASPVEHGMIVAQIKRMVQAQTPLGRYRKADRVGIQDAYDRYQRLGEGGLAQMPAGTAHHIRCEASRHPDFAIAAAMREEA